MIEVSTCDIHSPTFTDRLREELSAGNATFILIKDFPTDLTSRLSLETEMINRIVPLDVKKIFFPGDEKGLEIEEQFRSYPTVEQLREAIATKKRFNMPAEQVRFFIEQQEAHAIDLVLVQARRGTIYEEVFTHSGSGTLISQDYPNILRVATEVDVRDIMALMQPYVSEGTLKAVTEEEIISMIGSFTVYSVNEQIIAAGALIDYEDSCEIGKLCTLPRYQARGRARALVCALLDEAKRRGKASVFALTVSPVVGDFFERLGFQFTPREELPQKWQQGYDFSRPSKAYRYTLQS